MLRLALVLAGAALGACGGPPSPAEWSGHEAPRVVRAAQVREVTTRPDGYETIGKVSAECEAEDGVQEIDEAWLKDVDCFETLLVGSLKEKAAAVGGELLVGRRCSADSEDLGGARRVTERRCWARVARSKRPALAPGVTLAEPIEAYPVPYAFAGDAWRIKVTFTPPPRPERLRPPRRPDLVHEVAVLPVGRVLLGDIIARCEGECARRSVREAVRAAAGRVGADDVVGIACVRGRPGWVCTGRAAAYEKDPEFGPPGL